MADQGDINADERADKIFGAAGAEFTTLYYYTMRPVNSIGFGGERLKRPAGQPGAYGTI